MRETRPVIVIGDACVDVTVRLADLMVGHSDVYDSERLLPPFPAAGASATRRCLPQGWGWMTAFMGTIGDDYGGRFMLRELAERGIDTGLTIVDDSNTIFVFAFIDRKGSPDPVGVPPGRAAPTPTWT